MSKVKEVLVGLFARREQYVDLSAALYGVILYDMQAMVSTAGVHIRLPTAALYPACSLCLDYMCVLQYVFKLV